MKKLLALAGLAALVVSAPAAAATFTTDVQTIDFGTHTTEFDPNNPNQSYATQSFQLFDSTLGTLIGMTVEAIYQENTNLTLKNTGATPATGTINTTSTLYLDAADSNQDAVFQNIIPGVAAVGSTTCFGTRGCTSAALGANSSISVSSNSDVVDKQITDTTAADLAYFQSAGGGLAQVLATTQSLTNLSSTNSNLSYNQATTGSPTFKIFYTYTTATVPEPATWAMMIAGFGLVGLGMRRKGTAVLFN